MAADTPSTEAAPVSGMGSGEFRRFADFVPLMMWRADRAGAATHHNESWLAFTGRSADEELGHG